MKDRLNYSEMLLLLLQMKVVEAVGSVLIVDGTMGGPINSGVIVPGKAVALKMSRICSS